MNNKSRILLINFSKTSSAPKTIKVDKHIVFTSYKDLKEFIQQHLDSEEQFDIEVLNTVLGRYEKIDHTTILPIWDRGILSVLVVIKSNDKEALLSIKGRMFDTSTGLTINDQCVLINEDHAAHLGTGLNTWDGSVILAKYFERNQYLVRGKRILELGAGTGIAGISTLLLDASFVHFTDLSYTLPNLISNVKLNTKDIPQNRFMVSELDWNNQETYPKDVDNYDVIIGADIVWLEHLIPSLISTLKTLIVQKNKMFILSHQTRSTRTDSLLLKMLEEHFEVAQVKQEEYSVDNTYVSPNINIFHIYRISHD